MGGLIFLGGVVYLVSPLAWYWRNWVGCADRSEEGDGKHEGGF